MQFLAIGDTHFTHNTPTNRKDDYAQTQLDKFKQVLELARRYDCPIVHSGDFFESASEPYSVTKSLLDILTKQRYKDIKIFTTFGQHDIRYHIKGLNNTPLGILTTLPNVYILGSDYSLLEGKTSITGAGWDEEPKEDADILVTHRMVVHKNPLFPGQTDYSKAKNLLKKYNYKFIISGDNHNPFVETYEGKTLINVGSLMRKGKDQIDYKPSVWLFDSVSLKHKRISLEIKPAKDVFDFEKIEKNEIQQEIKKQVQEDMDKFMDSLNISEHDKPNFENVIKKIIKETNPKVEVIDIINQIMEELK